MRISLLDSRRMIASMKNVLILTVTSTSFGVTCLRGDDKPLFAPRPTKDPMASKKHCQGAGIFQMAVDRPSGKVKAVLVGRLNYEAILFFDELPYAIPIFAGRIPAKDLNALKEDTGRAVIRTNLKTFAK